VLAVAGVGSILADGDGESRGKMSWVVVDEDGTQHKETIEFDGPRPFLGVGLERTREGSGARIDSIEDDSAAEKAGLREGDVVVGYNGESIENPWDLTRAVLKSEIGERVDIEIERDGARQTISAELGEHEGWVGAFAFGEGDFDFNFDTDAFKEQMKRAKELAFDAEALEKHMEQLQESLQDMNFDFDVAPRMRFNFDDSGSFNFNFGKPRLGVELVNVTGELREHLGSNADEGVLVGRVLGDTPAEEAGVEVGDLIVAVGGETVGRQGDLIRLLRERDGETFNVDVIRDGRPLSLTVSLPERETKEFEPGRFQRRQRHQERSDST
jgi:serine protease Do